MGERHGFTITKKSPTDGAYYVVGKDIKKNILFVSQNSKQLLSLNPLLVEEGVGGGDSEKNHPAFGTPPPKGGEEIQIKDTNWISGTPKTDKIYTAQIRYHGEFLLCKIFCQSNALAKIVFEKPVLVAVGQSCVIYDKDVCLGGGVVI